jgi:hypothetical protein
MRRIGVRDNRASLERRSARSCLCHVLRSRWLLEFLASATSMNERELAHRSCDERFSCLLQNGSRHATPTGDFHDARGVASVRDASAPCLRTDHSSNTSEEVTRPWR